MDIASIVAQHRARATVGSAFVRLSAAAVWLGTVARMQLGMHIGQQNMTMDAMRALWRRADETLDWISVWDHLYEAPPAGGTIPHFEAVACLGALAADTTNARLGCLVFYVGYRNPGLLAKAATTIDHISGGRFELGIGGGWHEWEAEAYGYDFPAVGKRLDMLDEAAGLLSSYFTNERTTHDGEYFRAVDASMLPAPVRGEMPLWIGGVGEKRTLRLTAQYATGWNAAYVSPDEFARLNGVLDRHCADLGRDPASIERSINVMFDLGREEDELIEQWGSMWDRVAGGSLHGSVEQVVDRIGEYGAAGADMVNIAVRAPITPGALETYLGEVVPAVRAR